MSVTLDPTGEDTAGGAHEQDRAELRINSAITIRLNNSDNDCSYACNDFPSSGQGFHHTVH